MEVIQKIDVQVSNILNSVYKTQHVKAVVHLLLILYAARLAPEVPEVVSNLFSNVYFKLLIFSLILWTAQMSPSTSILIAIAFMVTLNYTNKKPLWEFLDNVDTTIQIVSDAVPAAVMATTDASPEIAQAIQAAIPTAVDAAMKTGDVKVAAQQAVQAVQTVQAEPAPEQPAPEQPAPEQPAPEQSGCYPIRKVDMSKVSAFEDGEEYGLVA